LHVAVAPELASVVSPAALVCDDVSVRVHAADLDAALHDAAEAARRAVERPDVTAAVRTMYRRVGIDPTKTRPSSEALLRRVRRGEDLPRINTAVDVINWSSLESQLPFGLYDAERLRGAPVLRLGQPGEEYPGIRKDVVHVSGRLTLADDEGPFGNPTSDSARTSVTVSTTQLLVVIFAPTSIPPADVQRTLAVTADRIRRYCGSAE
jgi:DNA/RNA-binding domain of Phe-tRNA-synthetase-like protein